MSLCFYTFLCHWQLWEKTINIQISFFSWGLCKNTVTQFVKRRNSGRSWLVVVLGSIQVVTQRYTINRSPLTLTTTIKQTGNRAYRCRRLLLSPVNHLYFCHVFGGITSTYKNLYIYIYISQLKDAGAGWHVFRSQWGRQPEHCEPNIPICKHVVLLTYAVIYSKLQSSIYDATMHTCPWPIFLVSAINTGSVVFL